MKNLIKGLITKKVIKTKKTKSEKSKNEKTKKIKLTKSELKLLNSEKLEKIKTELKQNYSDNKNGINSFKSKMNNIKLYENENNKLSDYSFFIGKNDFLINLKSVKFKTENEKILFNEYNKILSIGKGLILNDIQKIILEGLKYRLMLEFILNFNKNLNEKNIKNIKKLNQFFTNSNLKKLIKNNKFNDLNYLINDKSNDFLENSDNSENIFGKSNFNIELFNKLENNFLIDFIKKSENKKTNSIKKLKKQNQNEYENYKKSKNEYNNFINDLKLKNKFKSIYNLISFNIDNDLNNNSELKKVNILLNRIKSKLEKKHLFNEKKFNKIKKQVFNYYNIDNILNDYNIKKLNFYNKYKKVNSKIVNRLKYKSENYFNIHYGYLKAENEKNNIYNYTNFKLLNILDFDKTKNYKSFKYNSEKFNNELDFNQIIDNKNYNKKWINKLLIK